MDKQFLREMNLTASQKRFQKIMEYVVNHGVMDEAGPEGDPNAMGGDPAAMGGDDPAAMGGGDPNAMGGDPTAMGGDPNAMGGDPAAMGGDPNAMGGGDPAAGGPEGFAPAAPDGGMPMADPGVSPETAPAEGEDDDTEVIDVDELTDAQDEANDKISKLSHKFEKMVDALEGLSQKIDSNMTDTQALRDELAKRNPTPQEEASRRVDVSAPFNMHTTDFKPAIDSSVSATPDMYQITKSDVDSINDWANIAKELSNDELHQSLKNVMGF